MKTFQNVVNFSDAQDRELHKLIDSQIVTLKIDNNNVRSMKPSQFNISKANLSSQSQLKEFSEEVL